MTAKPRIRREMSSVSPSKPPFLWGAATAAHQVEGGNSGSDIWRMENLAGGAGGFHEPSGDAMDHYHRYPEDIGLLAAAGLNAYRFSVEWARIEPEPGQVSMAALDHYARMADACLAAGMAPVVTLHHFTSPLWLAREGGWDEDRAAERFALYAGAVARHMGDRVATWCTINEINLSNLGFQLVPARRARRLEKLREALASRIGTSAFSSFLIHDGRAPAVLKRAHALALAEIKTVRPAAQVGLTLALPDLQAAPGGEDQMRLTRAATQDEFLDITGADDFVGVQTYTRELFGAEGRLPPPEGDLTLTGWEVYPQALEASVRYAAGRTGKPVIVTENGIATADDAARIAYTQTALAGLARARADGIEVRGYLHWSALDNFEWMHGYGPTFGLIGVDRETFRRTPKPSLAWLGARARAEPDGPGSPAD